MKNKCMYIASTGVILALLILIQFLTRSFGQIITGFCVNFLLALSVLCLGIQSGLTLCVLSPVLAFILGIGPGVILFIPCIAVANMLFVCAIYFFYKSKINCNEIIKKETAVIIAAALKFSFLYLVLVKLLIPGLGLSNAAANSLSSLFSLSQLLTSFMGGSTASAISISFKNKKNAGQKYPAQ